TAGRGQRIGRISPSGTITEFPLPAGDLPAEITGGPDGNLWFTAGNNGAAQIGRLIPTGQLTEFALSRFDAACGIAVVPDGNLWFTGGPGVERITPAGVITGFSLPARGAGLTVGPDGNIWIAGSSGIMRFTLEGTQAAPTTTMLAADVSPVVSGQPVT